MGSNEPYKAATIQAVPGPFTTLPGKNVLDDFRKWVEETGRPDEWQHHTRSKPPPDKDFDELLRFEVPEKLRPIVGMARCPICSPDAPKYFAGALAWFPAEGVCRAIGHDCAAGHFGTERYNAAVATRIRRERIDGAQSYLLDVLPKIATMRAEANDLAIKAPEVDRLRQTFWSYATKHRCELLFRSAVNGVLSIETEAVSTKVDAFGKEQTLRTSQVVATFPIEGMAFLKDKYLVANQATSTLQLLELVHAADEEAALDLVCDLGESDHLFEADRLAHSAAKSLASLRDEIELARAFFGVRNLESLHNWSRDRRSGAHLQFRFEQRYPHLLTLQCPQKKPL